MLRPDDSAVASGLLSLSCGLELAIRCNLHQGLRQLATLHKCSCSSFSCLGSRNCRLDGQVLKHIIMDSLYLGASKVVFDMAPSKVMAYPMEMHQMETASETETAGSSPWVLPQQLLRAGQLQRSPHWAGSLPRAKL